MIFEAAHCHERPRLNKYPFHVTHNFFGFYCMGGPFFYLIIEEGTFDLCYGPGGPLSSLGFRVNSNEQAQG